jgi:glutathione synthase/RimK-type ligase-like ATP-grasp enzyme
VRRVALVTAEVARHLDADLPLLAGALEARGIAPSIVSWHDASVDWASFASVVVRSPWDYCEARADFVAWAERVAAVAPLANAAPVLRWNTDKHYLRDLEAAGVPITPTRFVEPGGEPAIGWEGEVVVKPAISAGAKDTQRYAASRHDEARAHVAALTGAGRTAMVQPYLARVDDAGETALVFFDGVFSHAVRKGPILRPDRVFVEGLYAAEHLEPRAPTQAELDVGARALAAVPGGARPLYARVDLVPGPGGEPLLLELELTEPSLFLGLAEGAADRMAAAIDARLAHEGTTEGGSR